MKKTILLLTILFTVTTLGFGRFGNKFTFPYSLFLKRDGSYDMLGNLDMGGYAVVNGTFSGVASTATYAENAELLDNYDYTHFVATTGAQAIAGDLSVFGYTVTASTFTGGILNITASGTNSSIY